MIHPLIARIGGTRTFRVLGPHLLPAVDRSVHRLSKGRWVPSRLVLPTVLLTTTGRRTGRQRTTPLCAHRYPDGGWLVAGTNFGRRHHPAWSTNLLHHPIATVSWRGHTERVTARRLRPEELAEERAHLLRIVPVYDTYAALAGRDVRVFRLTPTGRDAGAPPDVPAAAG
ncbi:nitroreductase family deazaflavin-dependent oxidoreductase [Wenjunlia vitaminophila]|nr:nitroreductase family deazaflavin-dependent oxidoreductase [Wenjunlia vitaminophila]